MSEMMRIRVQVDDKRHEVVDACKASTTGGKVLVLYDAEGGIRAQFTRWEYYVRVEAS